RIRSALPGRSTGPSGRSNERASTSCPFVIDKRRAGMRLYEFAPTRSIRPRWVLQELGVEFEAVTVDLIKGEQRTPAFLELNPSGQFPVLVDGDLVLTESVAISLYLAEKYPQKRLVPDESTQKAAVYRWLLFAATELEQPLWRMTKHTNLYPENKRLPA